MRQSDCRRTKGPQTTFYIMTNIFLFMVGFKHVRLILPERLVSYVTSFKFSLKHLV